MQGRFRDMAKGKNKLSDDEKLTLIFVFILASMLICIAMAHIISTFIQNREYNKAVDLINENDYVSAIEVLKPIENWKDSRALLISCYFNREEQLVYEAYDNKNYSYVVENIQLIKDNDKRNEMNLNSNYQCGISEFNNKNYEIALMYFSKCSKYLDTEEYKIKILNEISNKYTNKDYEYSGDNDNVSVPFGMFNIILNYGRSTDSDTDIQEYKEND